MTNRHPCHKSCTTQDLRTYGDLEGFCVTLLSYFFFFVFYVLGPKVYKCQYMKLNCFTNLIYQKFGFPIKLLNKSSFQGTPNEYYITPSYSFSIIETLIWLKGNIFIIRVNNQTVP